MNSRTLVGLIREWQSVALRAAPILDRQTQALKTRDVAEVEAIRPVLEALVAQASAIDAQREQAISDLAAKLDVEPNLAAIAEKLPHEEARLLNAAAKSAKRIAVTVEQRMGTNRALLENELVYAEGMLGLIAQAVQQSTPYGHAVAHSMWVNEVA